MDLAGIPIVDFLKYCRGGAKYRGFKWIVCILSRGSDSRELYNSIERDWLSLDSITGRRMLVLFAGNEKKCNSDVQRDLERYCLTDKYEGYVKRYSPFVTVLSERAGITTDLSSSQRFDFLSDYLPGVEKNQTDAIESLRKFLNIRENSIPCLVYIPLYEDSTPVKKIVVKLPSKNADLYGYFKKLFNQISPVIDDVFPVRSEQQARIDNAYEELISYANQSELKEELFECISKKQYLSCKQPERRLLSRYIDLCRNYKMENGEDYKPVGIGASDQLRTLEDALSSIGISSFKEESESGPMINIGNNNRLSHCKFNIYINKANNDN